MNRHTKYFHVDVITEPFVCTQPNVVSENYSAEIVDQIMASEDEAQVKIGEEGEKTEGLGNGELHFLVFQEEHDT